MSELQIMTSIPAVCLKLATLNTVHDNAAILIAAIFDCVNVCVHET